MTLQSSTINSVNSTATENQTPLLLLPSGALDWTLALGGAATCLLVGGFLFSKHTGSKAYLGVSFAALALSYQVILTGYRSSWNTLTGLSGVIFLASACGLYYFFEQQPDCC